MEVDPNQQAGVEEQENEEQNYHKAHCSLVGTNGIAWQNIYVGIVLDVVHVLPIISYQSSVRSFTFLHC